MENCPKCHHPFSDWFRVVGGLRHCYLCWLDRNEYQNGTTVLENGEVIKIT